MSNFLFHKSCYTSRSSGYKYRTIATNTGDKQKTTKDDETLIDRNFEEIKETINKKIGKHFEQTQKTRDMMSQKLDKVSSKIDSMLELQKSLKLLREDLSAAENTLINLQNRVDKLDVFSGSDTTLVYFPFPKAVK